VAKIIGGTDSGLNRTRRFLLVDYEPARAKARIERVRARCFAELGVDCATLRVGSRRLGGELHGTRGGG